MKNQEENIHFEFNLKLTLFVIVMLPVLISLGVWQLDRASEKKVMQQKVEQRFAQEPVDICSISEQQQTKNFLQYLPVKLVGEITEKYFLLDNQVHKGKVGYEVLQLIQVCKQEYIISRGFVKGNPDRRILPAIETHVAEMTKLEGYVYIPESNRFIEDEAYPDIPTWPLRVSQINFDAMSMYINDGIKLFPAVIRLKENQDLMLDAHWKLMSMKPEKHNAYAFQWFALALTLLGLFLYTSVKRKTKV